MESFCVRASINDTESIYRDLNIKLYFRFTGIDLNNSSKACFDRQLKEVST